jgi:hypothetical protein
LHTAASKTRATTKLCDAAVMPRAECVRARIGFWLWGSAAHSPK